MLNEIAEHWQAGVFVLMAISYFELMDYLSRRYHRNTPLSDHEILSSLARLMECSEYDIFEEAAKLWNFPVKRVAADFKTYLLAGQIPHYVTDFIRKYGRDIVMKRHRGSA
jgi:hypothetical protein